MPRRRPSVAPALALVLAAVPAGAVPLLTGFGGPSGHGTVDHCVHPSDDGSYAGPNVVGDGTPVPIDLTPAFPDGLGFFGRRFRSFYLNTNGNISLAAPLASPNPVAFPVADQPMVAPWWADVDTRLGGSPGENAVCYHLEPNRLVVTWHDVRRRGATDGRVNDFQMILSTSATCVSVGLDFEFRYNRCEWAAGEGGTPAQVGFDAGNRTNYVALPQSRSADITRVCETSNVMGGAPGLYRFQIRGGWIAGTCAGAGVPCSVAGALGTCAEGITVCDGIDRTACARLRNPGVPRCNGLDNDCDGAVDEGPALCGDGRTCDRGFCRQRCEGAGPCPTGQVCSSGGTCEERACVGVTCPEGRRCTQGACVDACEDVACPIGTRCRLGQCVNPCDRALCHDSTRCDDDSRSPTFGLCVYGCQCTPCPAGRVCMADGRCVDESCEGVICPTGSTCEAGACRDPCEAPAGGRLCLDDQVCAGGRCVPAREGGVADGGVVDGGAAGGAWVEPMVTERAGCGCRARGARTSSGAWVLVGLVMAARRRRPAPLCRSRTPPATSSFLLTANAGTETLVRDSSERGGGDRELMRGLLESHETWWARNPSRDRTRH